MEITEVFRRLCVCALAALSLACAPLAPAAFARQEASQSGGAQGAQKKEDAQKKEQPKRGPAPKPEKFDKDNPTAEQVAELVIFAFGSRAGLTQIRRTGVEHGKITRTGDDGRPQEISYDRTFKRGDTYEKDKIRLDQRLPSIEYSLIYNGGKVFGVLKGSTFTPKSQDITTMLSDRVHGLEALFHYKETGATIKLAGKDTQKGIEFWMLDLTDKEGNSTRYYVSAKTWRVLWLEYEGTDGKNPVKYRRTFHDYRVVQGTLVPYRTVLFADDKQVEESQVMTVTYGVKTEDNLFDATQSASLEQQ
jgi:hypothetical protein